MHNTQPADRFIDLFQRGRGRVWRFKNLDDAARHLGWIQSLGTIGDQFIEVQYHVGYVFPTYKYYDFVLRNDAGEVVTQGQLYGRWYAIRNKNRTLRRWAWRGYPNPYHPGRKNNRHRGSYYRLIRTFQERKWAHAWEDEEYAPKVRARRNAKNLPNSWDDFLRSDMDNNKNWKQYRKHQWKCKKEGC